MERNLALEVVRATEAAALAAARFIGKGDERLADRAACDAMRKTLNSVAMDGKIVIGEGKEGDAEVLYEDEIVGTGAGTEIDVALDAIEGSLICATGGPNALSCVALAERGRILRCPDTYMDKVACGPAGRGVIDIDRSPTDNLKALADAKATEAMSVTVPAANKTAGHFFTLLSFKVSMSSILLLSREPWVPAAMLVVPTNRLRDPTADCAA